MKIVFHILSGADLYEIAMHGRLVTRITRYINGTQHFTEIKDWDALSEEIQQKIESRANELIPDDA